MSKTKLKRLLFRVPAKYCNNYFFLNFKIPGIVFILLITLSACNRIDDILDIKPTVNDITGSGPDKVKFVAIGDAGKGNDGQFKVARAIKEKCDKDGCDFVLMLGDNIYNSGVNSVDDPQFQAKFEEPYKNLSIPFYMVLGNHDYGGDGVGYDIVKSIYQLKYTEISSKWILPRHYYKFKVQNSTFFALDTNAQLYNQAKDQIQDVPLWITEANTTWKIAFGHHPYKSNGRHGNAGNYDGTSGVRIISGDGVKKFAESVWCGKVDLYIAAHDHNRQWLATDCKGTQLAISGAGASTTKLRGNNPSLFETDTLGLLYISIDGNVLTVEFVDIDGKTEFTHKLIKN